MNTTLASSVADSRPTTPVKPLWAALGVVSVCALAMGATLVHVSKRPEPLACASIPLAVGLALFAMDVPEGMNRKQKYPEKTPLAGMKYMQTATKFVASPALPPRATTPITEAPPQGTAPSR